jgi:hypothetical protein
MRAVKRLRFVSALVVLVTVAGFAIPVAASAGGTSLLPACGPVTHPFAQFGDFDGYCAFPNLGFENGSKSWTLGGAASVVSGNEPWNVSGPGSHSLQLGPGATALSSSLPINLLDPWIRFFARSNGANGSLAVQVRFVGPLGNVTGLLNIGSLAPSGFASWHPTPPVLSLLALPLGTTSAEVYVHNQSTRGSWLVDDFYLDPCASKFG